VSFTNAPSRFELRVSLPASTVGRISVPLSSRAQARALANEPVQVSINGVLVAASEIDNGYAVIEVGGGRHIFVSDDAVL
jgi:hypothetical protein